MTNTLLTIMTTILLVAGFITGFNLFVTDLTNNYDDVTLSEGYKNITRQYNATLDDVTLQAYNMQNRTSGTQASQDTDSGISLENSLKAISLVWGSFDYVNDMTDIVAEKLSIPTLYVWLLSGVLLLSILFLVLSAILKFRV